jgi:hypothetical protein
MARVVTVSIVLFIASWVFMTDTFGGPEQIFIATTGRIIMINATARTILVRGSDDPPVVSNSPATQESSKRCNVVRMLRIMLGGVGAGLPEITVKMPQSKSSSDLANSLDEYTVVTTDETEFKNGGESIRFDDFKSGETISIHGVLKGKTLTASRLAKWD